MKKSNLIAAVAAGSLLMSTGAFAQDANNLGPAAIGGAQSGLFANGGITGTGMLVGAVAVMVVAYAVAADNIDDDDSGTGGPPELPGAPHHWDGPTQHVSDLP